MAGLLAAHGQPRKAARDPAGRAASLVHKKNEKACEPLRFVVNPAGWNLNQIMVDLRKINEFRKISTLIPASKPPPGFSKQIV